MSFVHHAFDASSLMRAAGYEPDPWQQKLLQSTPHRGLLLCSRRAGKSLCAAVLALHRAVTQPGTETVLLSASQQQSSELLRTVRSVHLDASIELTTEQDSARSLAVGHPGARESRIISLPALPRSVRGYTADLLVIDEASFLEPEMYEAALPLIATGGDLLALTTPAGRVGWFHSAWTDETAFPGFDRIKVTAEDVPRISRTFLDEQRQQIGERAFRQEYLCEFEDAISSMFRSEHIAAASTEGTTGFEVDGPDFWSAISNELKEKGIKP